MASSRVCHIDTASLDDNLASCIIRSLFITVWAGCMIAVQVQGPRRNLEHGLVLNSQSVLRNEVCSYAIAS